MHSAIQTNGRSEFDWIYSILDLIKGINMPTSIATHEVSRGAVVSKEELLAAGILFYDLESINPNINFSSKFNKNLGVKIPGLDISFHYNQTTKLLTDSM